MDYGRELRTHIEAHTPKILEFLQKCQQYALEKRHHPQQTVLVILNSYMYICIFLSLTLNNSK